MRVVLLATFVAVLFVSPAGAQIVNGGFDTDLNGWSLGTIGDGDVPAWSPTGNPGGSVLLSFDAPFFPTDFGGATVSQDFWCGDPGEEGTCLIGVEYRYVTGGLDDVPVEVLVDGISYHSVQVSGTGNWTPVFVNVGCGFHNLTVRAGDAFTVWVDDWDVWVDNATGLCEGTVSEGMESFGVLKARFGD